ncbi:hypothetical protein SO802_008214 [Lithocarpus litseifolius]|uniref:MYB transcription factor n=1 Tax=Lithocarpus litseifolius TaxID=425828 RepID=A0AAW2D7Y4_9ROSI
MNSLLSSDLRYNLKSPPRAVWSPEENKKFEELIKEIPLDCPHIFEKIARELPSKSILDIKEHYGSLIEGVFIRHRPSFIEVPNYGNSEIVEEIPNKKKKGKEVAPTVEEKPKKKRGMGDQWTKEEHELFEEGLKIYGKGDWKSIARHVSTKNNTQIASHAQKYFLRLEKTHAQQNVTCSFGSSKASTSKDVPMSPIASATHLPMQSDAFPIHPSYIAYPSNKFHH